VHRGYVKSCSLIAGAERTEGDQAVAPGAAALALGVRAAHFGFLIARGSHQV
jgi:hypothetical protein